jgi:hypothetical protein
MLLKKTHSFSIGESNSNRLRKKDHIRNLIPRIWIQRSGQILGDVARTQLCKQSAWYPLPKAETPTLEQSNQGIAAGPAVQPQRYWIVSRIPTRLEEPEEGVDIWCQVDEAGVGVHAWGGFADTGFAGLFVSNCDIAWGGDGRDSSGING